MNRNKNLELSVLIMDLVTFCISYFLSAYLYLVLIQKDTNFFITFTYRTFSLYLIAFLLAEFYTISKNRLFLQRTKKEELFNVIKVIILISLIFVTLVFITQYGMNVSRMVFLLTFISSIILGYIGRSMLVKIYESKKSGKTQLYIITTSASNKPYLINKATNGLVANLKGVIILDSLNETSMGCVDAITLMKKESVDCVLFILNEVEMKEYSKMIEEIQSMGIITHFQLGILQTNPTLQSKLTYVGTLPVLSYSSTFISEESLILKRGIDIIGGFIGSIVALFFMVIIGPIIKLESKGPVFFKQKRVSKNGRIFEIYKFRSMVVNAEQQKESLRSQNEVDGHMFKITNDPRVTKVGKFIRATSIDEFPQFFNVLKGDMSLVGTRPPTVDEYLQYDSHHIKRLMMKPGITGMWQVSGRSNISDFEEIVKLDTEYIENFSLALDLKILAKTFVVVLSRDGSK